MKILFQVQRMIESIQNQTKVLALSLGLCAKPEERDRKGCVVSKTVQTERTVLDMEVLVRSRKLSLRNCKPCSLTM